MIELFTHPFTLGFIGGVLIAILIIAFIRGGTRD